MAYSAATKSDFGKSSAELNAEVSEYRCNFNDILIITQLINRIVSSPIKSILPIRPITNI